jgi:hypothetical protein
VSRPTDAEALTALRTLAAWLTPSSATKPAEYTSRGPLPTYGGHPISLDTFHRKVKSIPSARRDGRVWVVSVDAWDAACARATAAPKAKIAAPPPVDSVDAILAAGGTKLRAVAGGRR